MNHKLAAEYGTQSKEANSEAAQRMVLALLGFTAGTADLAHVERMTAEADYLNEKIRALESSKMEQTVSGLERKMAAALPYLNKAVRAAAVASAGRDKVAVGTLMSDAFKKGRKAFGGFAQDIKGGLKEVQTGAKAPSSLPNQIISPKHKAQAVLGAGALGLGYGGYKGLQAGRDWMARPPKVERWGNSAPLRYGVNEYGYPE